MSLRSRSAIFRFTASLACVGLTAAFTGCGKTEKEPPAAPKVTTPAPAPAPAPKVTAAPTVTLPPMAGAATKPGGTEIQSVDQRVSYGIGYNIGSTLGKQQAEIAIDPDSLKAGLEDGLAGAKTRILDSDIRAAFALVQEKANAKQLALTKTFFDRNRTREGVMVTPSGLQYQVLKRGTGTVKPKLTNTVTVNYEGKLLDGTVFDASSQHGGPATFGLNNVIKGWSEGLQLMTVGDKFLLFVPSNLGYGPNGNGRIPPNSALVFEVELLGIK